MWIHRSCLDHWRATRHEDAFSHCTTCHFQYVIEPLDPSRDDQSAKVCRFRMLVARDSFGLLLAWQAVIALIALLVYGMDSGSGALLRIFPASFQNSPVGTYYLCGVVIFFAILGLVGSCAFCCNCGDSRNMNCDGMVCCYYCYGPCNCHCDCGGGGGGNCCNNCNCNCNSGDDAAAVLLVILLVVVIALAVLGVFIGIAVASVTLQRLYQKHSRVLWLREETQRFVVKDLAGIDLEAFAPDRADAPPNYAALYAPNAPLPQPLPAPGWLYQPAANPVSACAPSCQGPPQQSFPAPSAGQQYFAPSAPLMPLMPADARDSSLL